jgi:thiol-disulfide isomerase/thioredoxin
MKRVPLALQTLLIAIVVLGVGAYLLLRGPGESLSTTQVKKQNLEALYATALPDLDGRIQPLKQWRGKVLVVNYWATWCAPCRDEMPMLSLLQTRYAARDVQFVGIANDEVNKVREFVKHTPVTYPLLIGNFNDFGITVDLGNTAMGLPFTVVLDREGKLQEATLGRVEEKALVRLLDGLVQDR